MDLNKYWHGIQEGDERILEALFKEINGYLCYYAHYLTGDYSLAEEIVQDVFLKIWQDRNRINIRGSLRSYLYKAVRNQSINLLIHKKTKKYSVNNLLPDESWHAIQEILEVDDNIIEKIESLETENHIRSIIENLPEQCRKIFMLSRFEDKTNMEIALELKISVNTVKTQIYRALDNIRNNFEQFSD